MTAAPAATIAVPTTEPWVLPSKGRVGMICLIVAESAVFVIFIVAYLYYAGQSLTGPLPRRARAADLHQHLPAREQPDDFGGGSRARARTNGRIQALVARHDRPGFDLHGRHGARMVSADLRAWPHDPDEPLRHDLLLARRAARHARDPGPGGAHSRHGAGVARTHSSASMPSAPMCWPCTGTSSMSCGSSCSRWSTSSGVETEKHTHGSHTRFGIQHPLSRAASTDGVSDRPERGRGAAVCRPPDERGHLDPWRHFDGGRSRGLVP